VKKIWIALLLGMLLLLLCGCGPALPAPAPGEAAREEQGAAPASAAPAPRTLPSPPPLPVQPGDGELVRLRDHAPEIREDLRYAGENNFTGQVIYDFSEAWLRYGTVQKLRAAQESLNARGYGLLVWDAYRPQAAQFLLWSVVPDPVYVANPYAGHSGHSNGGTVDITLIALDGSPVEMPSGFDEFSPLADRDYSDVSPAAAEHARILERAMTDAGFVPYAGEWWHYADSEAYPYEDLEAIRLPAAGEDFSLTERAISLRMAPDPRAAALLLVPRGTRLPILGFAGDWIRVEYRGQQGYLARNELQDPEPRT
jgi:D-alanyl-D-alanine dipeptidase